MKRLTAICVLLILFIGSAHAQSLIQSWHTTDVASTDNVACTSAWSIVLPTVTTTAGDTITVSAGQTHTSATVVSISSVTDAQADSFSKLVGKTTSGQSNETYIAKNIAGGSTVVTVTFSAGGTTCSGGAVAMEFSPITGTVDQTATAYGTSIDPTTGDTATTGNANDLLIISFSANANAGASSGPSSASGDTVPGAGYTAVTGSSVATRKQEVGAGYAFSTLKAKYGASWGFPASTPWTSAIGALYASIGTATLSSIAISPVTPSVQVGRVQSFTATGTYSDGGTGDITNSAAWTSSDITKATMSGATATGVAVGTSTITATLSGKSKSTVLSVIAAQPGCPNPMLEPTGLPACLGTLASIAVTPATISIPQNGTQAFAATATYTSPACSQDITSLATWTSSAPAVATMSQNTATALSAGTATITATSGAVTGTAAVTVIGPLPTSTPGAAATNGPSTSYWP